MSIPPPLLEKIRLQLPYGAQKTIARTCGVSAVTVHQVLAGKLKQPIVLAAALKFYVAEAQERATTLQELQLVVLQPGFDC
jgi:hypothetical protein